MPPGTAKLFDGQEIRITSLAFRVNRKITGNANGTNGLSYSQKNKGEIICQNQLTEIIRKLVWRIHQRHCYLDKVRL